MSFFFSSFFPLFPLLPFSPSSSFFSLSFSLFIIEGGDTLSSFQKHKCNSARALLRNLRVKYSNRDQMSFMVKSMNWRNFSTVKISTNSFSTKGPNSETIQHTFFCNFPKVPKITKMFGRVFYLSCYYFFLNIFLKNKFTSADSIGRNNIITFSISYVISVIKVRIMDFIHKKKISKYGNKKHTSIIHALMGCWCTRVSFLSIVFSFSFLLPLNFLHLLFFFLMQPTKDCNDSREAM